MRRLLGTLSLFCLSLAVTAGAQSLIPVSSRTSGHVPLEVVVGSQYTHLAGLPALPSCDPYSYYYDPTCDPMPSGPNYGSGTSSFAQQHFVPHIVAGGGFITIITITNLASTSNSGQLLYWGQDGSTISRTGFTLPAGATMRLQTPESARFGASSVQWLTVSSNQNVGINSFFELRDSSGKVTNTIGFNDPAENTFFYIPVEFAPAPGGGFAHTVGLAIADDTSTPASITMRLYNSQGSMVATAIRSLSSFEQTAIDLSTVPEFQSVLPTGDFIGTVTVSSDNVISSIALQDDVGPFYATPGLPTATFGQMVVPHIISGGGFVTRLTLLNLDVVNNSFDVKFYDQSGKLLNEQTVNVPAGGTGRLSTGEASRFSPTQISWALVTASAGGAVNSFFELEDSTGRVINTIGFNHAAPITDFTVPVEFMPNARTVGLGIANPSGSSANVTLKLIDSNGTVMATSTITLAPNAQQGIDLANLAQFKAVLPAADLVGVVTVSSSAPISTIALGDDFGPFYSTPTMAGRAQ